MHIKKYICNFAHTIIILYQKLPAARIYTIKEMYYYERRYSEEWIKSHLLEPGINNNAYLETCNYSSDQKKDLEILQQLITEGRSLDYIWYYINHMYVPELEDELISLRSHCYEVALQKEAEKLEAEELASIYYYTHWSFEELDQKYPNQWQKELIASISFFNLNAYGMYLMKMN